MHTAKHWRVISALAITLGVAGAAMVAVPPSALAGTSSSYEHYEYGGYFTTYYHNRGIVGNINYESEDITVDNPNTDHGLMYFDVNGTDDPGVGYGTFGWVQAGYARGNVDGLVAQNAQVYVEVNGPNTGPTPYAQYFPYAHGNRWFGVDFTGEVRDGRGRYEATYSLQDTMLGYGYIKDPTGTMQEGVVEGITEVAASRCPYIDGAFGTDGTSGYSGITVLNIHTNSPNSPYVPWLPVFVASTAIDGPRYYLIVYNTNDAYEAVGGG